MIKFLLKNSLIFSLLFLASCSVFKRNDSKKIRIVDLQGKSHNVKTRVPEMNAQILKSQGYAPQNNQQDGDGFAFNGAVDSQEEDSVIKNKYATADYEAASSELASQNSKVQDLGSPKTIIQDSSDSKISAGRISAEKSVEVEYDLSDSKEVNNPSKKAVILGKYKISKTSPSESEGDLTESAKGIFVQTGAFSSERNAKNSASTMSKFAKTQIEEAEKDGAKIYRVLLGSFSNKSEAGKVIKKIKSAGYDAILVRKN